MIAIALAALAGLGVFYLYTAVVYRWDGYRPGPERPKHDRGSRARQWLAQAGLADLDPREFAAVSAAVGVVGFLAGYAVLASPIAAVVIGLFAASFPIASSRVRRRARMAKAQEAWPRMIEEIRILTGALGRSIPQALFDVGRRAPSDLRPAFAAAEREWVISTDFRRTVQVLKARLADPTADACCETLLIAQELGGADLDRRLASLAEDRIQDTQGRKDARAKQAGVRFARWFVLIVPFSMAVVGLTLGDGRNAYRTPTGQAMAIVAIALIVACWIWSGRIMRLPEERRVFDR